ncbi:MAG: CrcB family protein [Halobacteriales archaeon]|nr:CrcB family protein [Halobacteriales archaeon]
MPDDHLLLRIEPYALIAIGGFTGASLRFGLGRVVPGIGATLVVNTIGSLVLGFVLYEAIYAGLLSDRTRFVVATGFLSSFTTYSTFALETVTSPELALLNVLATYTLGFGGVLLGRELAARVREPTSSEGA